MAEMPPDTVMRTTGEPTALRPAAPAAAMSRPLSSRSSRSELEATPTRSALTCAMDGVSLTGFIWKAWRGCVRASRYVKRRLGQPVSEHGHGEERPERIVRLAEAAGQQPSDRPQHLVRHLAIEVEQHLEVGTGDGQHLGPAIGDGMCGSLAPVQHGHLAEQRPRFQDGQRLLAASRHVATDAHVSLDDEVKAVSMLTFAEDVFSADVLLD